MTSGDRSLRSLATASLFFALATVPLRAESGSTADPSNGFGKAQAELAQNEYSIGQGYGTNRPPGEIGGAGADPYAGEQTDGSSLDSAGLLVRIGRLESQMRQLNGQIEQMQFETRKLEEQLKKFQEDVDFRFRGGAPQAPAAEPQRRGEAPETQINGPDRSFAQSPAAESSRAGRRSDAFDPAQNPAAPGAPRPLGSHAPAAAVGRPGGEGSPGFDSGDPGAPLDLSGGWSRNAAAPATAPVSPGVPQSGVKTPGGTVIAALPRSPKEEFDIALAYFKQKSYENAAKSFAAFLEKNPKDKMASEATYFRGESFYLLGRYREAAEQYLKIPAQYPGSPRAPEALLRLGQSLNVLGAKEQACATFGEIVRKYPNAPAMVKTGAEREAKRAQC
jgi:tol-pal system protein YbgF